MPNTLDNLRWRYATKRYDTTKKLSPEQLDIVMEALRLAPSSFGLQPWKFIHVVNPELRERLKAAAWNQPQVTEASDLFILCALPTMDEAHIDAFIASTAEQRGVAVESLAGYRQMLVGSAQAKSEEARAEWNTRQVYLALGFALAAAAENRIDASPMEGFDPGKADEILGLEKLGVRSRVMLAVGFRSPDDEAQKMAKVRFSRNDVIVDM